MLILKTCWAPISTESDFNWKPAILAHCILVHEFVSYIKQLSVKVSHSKYSHPKIAHRSDMALIVIGKWKATNWFRTVKTDHLNWSIKNKSSELNDEENLEVIEFISL